MDSSQVVSVVLPFYNAERFLKEAIDSALCQTFQEWELLLVDDGSNDTSTQIAIQYCEKFPDKIRYLNHTGHKNRGLSASRNAGIRNSTGRYIAFLDADDVWIPDKLRQQVEILETNKYVGATCGRSIYWNGWSNNSGKPDSYTKIGSEANTVIHPPTLLILNLRYSHSNISMSNIMIKRDVLDKVGLFEDTIADIFEDMHFMAKLLLNTPVYVSNSFWDYYRQHSDSIMGKLNRDQIQNIHRYIFYLDWLEKYAKASESLDSELISAIEWRRNKLNNELWWLKKPVLSKTYNVYNKTVRRTKKTIKGFASAGLPPYSITNIISGKDQH